MLWGDSMLNKKGSTLLELVISIALISVVLIFLTRLIIDLNNTETNNVFAKDNQIVRSEILRVIEKDLNVSSLVGLRDESVENKLVISFIFKDGNAKIEALNNKISYTNKEGKLRTWSIKEGTVYVDKANVSLLYNGTSDVYTLEIDIEIHTANDLNTVNNNNILDDISISYMGKYKSISENITCFGYACSGSRSVDITL